MPLLGVTAAFVFAAQMLNFPIAGGTSGHFLGAALAAILLGPWLACLTLAVVLGVQAFVFADGGLTALGANVFNMGVLGALVVGGLMHARAAPSRRSTLLPIAAVGAWLAVMVGAAATALELARLGTVPLGTVLPGDARHPPADRRRRGGHHRRRRQRRRQHPTRPLIGRPSRPALACVKRLHDPRARAGDRARHRRLAVRVLAARTASSASPPTRASSTPAARRSGRSPTTPSRASRTSALATGLAGFTGTLIVFGLGYAIVAAPRRPTSHERGLHAVGVAGDPHSPIHRLDPRAKLIGLSGSHARRGLHAAQRLAGLRRVRRSRWSPSPRSPASRRATLWRRAKVVLPLVLFVAIFVPFVREASRRPRAGHDLRRPDRRDGQRKAILGTLSAPSCSARPRASRTSCTRSSA